MKRSERGRPEPAPAVPLRAAMLPGGAVIFDASGQVSFGLSDESLDALVGDAPDFVRSAVAHLAAAGAVEAGLVRTVEADGAAGEQGPPAGLPPPTPRATDVDASVRVTRSRAFLDAQLLSACLRARREGVATLPLVESPGRLFVGPLLAPDSSPCIVCLRRAVSPNRVSERLIGPDAGMASGHALSDVAAARLVLEESSSPHRELLEVDATGAVVGRHHVRSDPHCRVCGREGRPRNLARPELVARPAAAMTDTGARVCPAEETFAAYQHLLSPVSGAVRRLRPVETGAPDLIHVYTASHAMSEPSRTYAAAMRDGRDHSGGKGSSAAQARVSALCEALERFSAVAAGGEVDVTGRLEEVEGAIDPSACLLFSETQYRARATWNRSMSRFHHVPEPFDAKSVVAWSRVWCLRTGVPAYLPTSLLYFDFGGPGSTSCTADSNGLAAGRTLEEAVLQGLLEVVERDAVAIWWYNRIRMPEVDVGGFSDPYVSAVFEHYATIGRRAWVLDLTSDLGIPVFAALSALEDAGRPEVIFGFGAHLDPAIALRRCVTEMGQMLATARKPPEEREKQLKGPFDDVLRWWKEATLEGNPYLLPDPELERRGRATYTCLASDDLKEDVETCVGVAARHGLSVYVRDVTRADLGIPVAKVVVPGLRHFWRRLAPGRLYEAPVAMGRLVAPRGEADLNRVSLFV